MAFLGECSVLLMHLKLPVFRSDSNIHVPLMLLSFPGERTRSKPRDKKGSLESPEVTRRNQARPNRTKEGPEPVGPELESLWPSGTKPPKSEPIPIKAGRPEGSYLNSYPVHCSSIPFQATVYMHISDYNNLL